MPTRLDGLFGKFSPASSAAVAAARVRASGRGDTEVRAIDLFAAIVEDERYLPPHFEAIALLRGSASAEAAGPSGQGAAADVRWSAEFHAMIEAGARVALTSRAVAVEPEHLLLGMLQTDNSALRLLRQADADLFAYEASLRRPLR